MTNTFVFAVCGGKEHIETLNHSIAFLKKRTSNRIVVVTDLRRNEGEIHHNDIISVETDPKFNHHQAAILLKTSLHRILPKGINYMYLDTDILAIGENINNIFATYHSPINFAADHCQMMQFSPYSVNCNCLTEMQHYRELLERLMDKEDPLRKSTQLEIVEKRKRLEAFYMNLRHNLRQKIFTTLKYALSGKNFELFPDIIFNKKEKVWKGPNGEFIMKSLDMPKLAKQAGLKWNKLKMEPQLPDGRNVWQDQCTHLQQKIQEKFKVIITQPNWQHWNGGVFLFNDDSYNFLETWHQFTLQIFNYPDWKTRDQGTLIATVWKFGLQNHPTLDPKWNCLADYHNPNLALSTDKQTITLDGRNFFKPEFLHIYHHWDDKTWDIWNWALNFK